eukprot:6035087-Prymnesium_polylepis.1
MDELLWRRCENAREAMVTVQRAARARGARALALGTACAHLIVLLRLSVAVRRRRRPKPTECPPAPDCRRSRRPQRR